MTTVHTRTGRVPRAAARLRLPLWQHGQGRLRQRYGFDLSAADAPQRVDALLAEAPYDAERVLLHAAVLSTRGDDEQALAEAQRAVQLDDHLARAHTTLAAILVQHGRIDEALPHARRAAELDAGDPAVQYNLGLAEHAAGGAAASRQAFRRAEETLGLARPGRRSWRFWRRG